MQNYVMTICFVILKGSLKADLRVAPHTRKTLAKEVSRVRPRKPEGDIFTALQTSIILYLFISSTMQSSGRVLASSARSTVLRLSRSNTTNGIRSFHSRPPPSILVSSAGSQRRGYRRTTVSLKEDDDRRSKSPKDVEKQSSEESDQHKPEVDPENAAKEEEQKTAEKSVDSAKDK